jgi:cytidylate kinase
MNRRPLITIDGPAGAGKSTISRLLASRLSFVYLDTGALYRALAYHLQSGGWNGDAGGLGDSLRNVRIGFRGQGEEFRVLLDGEDVSGRIRTEEIGLLASRISAYPQIRDYLLPVQREIGMEGGVVAEGRDMGTVVFPEADFKFFLDASPQERARRRYREMIATGATADLQKIEEDMRQRDRQDRMRAIAPLRVPEQAVVVDSSDRTILQVVEFMVSVIGGGLSNGPDKKI